MKTIKTLFGILTITAALALRVHAQNFLTNGLVAFYPLDGNANDASGLAANGVFNGATISPTNNQAGVTNGALHFGGGSYLSVTPTPFNVNSNWTISFFCIVDSSAEQVDNFVSTGVDNDRGINMRYVYASPLHSLQWQLDSAIPLYTGFSGNSPTIWNMFTAVNTLVDGTNQLEMFLDGSLKYSTNGVFTFTDTGSVWFGRHQDAAGFYYDDIGSLSDIRIYDRALSTCEVQQLYTFESESNNLILNGSFESPVIPTNTYQAETPSFWTWSGAGPYGYIFNGNVPFSYGEPPANWPPPEAGQQFVDIGDDTGSLSQAFTITNLGVYILSWFDNTGKSGGMTGAPYSVTVINGTDQTVTSNNFDAYNATSAWVVRNVQLALSPGVYTLQFAGLTGLGDLDALIDNVSLVQMPPPPADCAAPPNAVCANVTVMLNSGNCTTNVAAYLLNNGSTPGTAGDTLSYNAIPPGPYPIGTNAVTLWVIENNGLSNNCLASVIVLNQQPPQLTCPAAVTVPANSGCVATNVSLGIPVINDCAAASVTNNASASFPLGTNLVTWTVADANGNSNSCQQLVVVLDTTPPVIGTNAALTVPAGPGVCYATNISLVTPVASDICEAVTVTNNAPAQFPVGTNTVTWTAVDSSGNIATSQQQVIVQDTQRPNINCPADVTVVADQDQCYATGVSIGAATASDNCSVASLINNAPVQFAVGVDAVLWTATDPSGNVGFCVQHVTVLDVQPPTISCPPDVILTNTSPVTNVNLGIPSASDNCSVTNVTNNAPTTFPVGTTIVKWTATDASGNTANCEQRVTVGTSSASGLLTGTPNANGSLTLNYTGVPSQQYHVQVSSNLAPSPNWMNLPGSTNQAAGNGAFSFTDTNTANFNPRFYRAVSP